MRACLFFSLHKAGLGETGGIFAWVGGFSNVSGCQATQEATAPELCCPDRGVVEEEKGGAGTQEAGVTQRLCFLIPP